MGRELGRVERWWGDVGRKWYHLCENEVSRVERWGETVREVERVRRDVRREVAMKGESPMRE